jgi:hypothetical protein
MSPNRSPVLESLESRIAPASVLLADGAQLLSAGDSGTLDGSQPLIKVLGGKALVFWDDANKAITGISLSNNARLEILGNVDGDIITNLTDTGFLSDSDGNAANGLDGGRLLASNIAGIKISSYVDSNGVAQNGNVGRIIAGGSISNVFVGGSLEGVYAGDGIFDAVATGANAPFTESVGVTSINVDVLRDIDGSGGPLATTVMTLTRGNALFASTASITNLNFGSGDAVQIFAGDGLDLAGTSTAGGSINNVRFAGALVDGAIGAGFFQGKSYVISAGNGGGGGITGGAGGAINLVIETGSVGDVVIQAGNGGNGTSLGGAGGKISLLDLQGNPNNYLVNAGNGGNGATAGAGGSLERNSLAPLGTSQLITLIGDFDNAGASDDVFAISRSSGQIVYIDGTTDVVGAPLAPLATAVTDAISADLDGDGDLDVVLTYKSGFFGILRNDGAGAFTYSVTELGSGAIKVIAGDFFNDGDSNLELAFLSTTSTTTEVRVLGLTDAVAFGGASPSDGYTSSPTAVGVLTVRTGNLVDALGGRNATATAGSMQLDTGAGDDLILGFAAGGLQGLRATGSGTTLDPFRFVLGPSIAVGSGLRDLSFALDNTPVPDPAGTNVGRILAVTSNGGAVRLVNVFSPSVPATNNSFSLLTGVAPVLPAGSGTILKGEFLADFDVNTDDQILLAESNGSQSRLLVYGDILGQLVLAETFTADFAVNSFSTNFPELGNGPADSFTFTTGDSTALFVQDGLLPNGGNLNPDLFALPFSPVAIILNAGNGGAATTGAGGTGGSVIGLNIDGNIATVNAGNGGVSTTGAGGAGGSINNPANFATASGVVLRPSIATDGNLNLYAGNGANNTGALSGSRGGAGGSISGVLVVAANDVSFNAGAGGSAVAATAGAGGSITGARFFNIAGDVLLNAGDGGAGLFNAAASQAAGGAGGSITDVVGGNRQGNNLLKIISGNVGLYAGDGGSSAEASAGNGGSLSKVTFRELAELVNGHVFRAGDGGNSTGLPTSSRGGNGGLIDDLFVENVYIAGPSDSDYSVRAGNGGTSLNGLGGLGGNANNIRLISEAGYQTGNISIYAGSGGAASLAGGAGGNLSLVTVQETGGLLLLEAGDGGNSNLALGGRGGNLTNVNANDLVALAGRHVFYGGTGGSSNGVVASAAGGAGGQINGLTLNRVDTQVFAIAGGGGSSQNGAGGAGGLLTRLTATDLTVAGIYHVINAGGGGGSIGALASANGGAGGALSALVLNNVASVLYIASGDGGGANGGLGGQGGAVSGATLDTILSNLYLSAGDGGGSIGGSGGQGGGLTGAVLDTIVSNAFLSAGDGGGSTGGSGGQGGGLTGTVLDTVYSNVYLSAGDGGGSIGGSGGHGGAVTTVRAVDFSINQSRLAIYGGDGGNSTGPGRGNGGNGGAITGLTAVNGALLGIYAGSGGSVTNGASTGRAGNGGAISSVRADIFDSGYSAFIAGNGGNTLSTGAGGNGGAATAISLRVNPDDTDPLVAVDETLGVTVQAGSGGNGGSGGIGGALASFDITATYDQSVPSETIINAVAVNLQAGNGGNGTVGNGGIGGSVSLAKTLLGISHIDEDSLNGNFAPGDAALRVQAGDGGNGVTIGGAGGSVTGVRTANVANSLGQVIPKTLLGDAEILAGNGGNATNGIAGSGGSIGGLNLVVERFLHPFTNNTSEAGSLRILAGDGGNATTGTGGLGGNINSSTLISINGSNTDGYGLLVLSGDGGDGSVRGAAGGGINSLIINLPEVGSGGTNPTLYTAVFIAGDGGEGTGVANSFGGAGGNISGITQTKDANSIINLIQAGQGGDSSADRVGGKGGDVSSIRTLGSIGAASANAVLQGLFNDQAVSAEIDALATTPNLQQGVFGGLGGSGSVDGANGRISGINARQIAALAAGDLAGNFEDAASIATITTLLLGFDINGSNTFDAGDGFVRGNTFTGLTSLDQNIITNVALNARTSAFVL